MFPDFLLGIRIARFLLMSVVAGGAFGLAEVRAMATPDLGAFGTATVDGVYSPGEWEGAPAYDFAVNMLDGTTVPATLFVMNDYQNLYLAVRMNAPLLYSSIAVEFDKPNAGGPAAGTDAIVLNSELGFYDDVRLPNGTAPGDLDVGGTNDGASAVTANGQFTFYEMSHPLSSGDAYDFSLAPGDLVGYFSYLTQCGFNACIDTFFPPSDGGALPRIRIYPWQPSTDTTPPLITVAAAPARIWPPNHKMVPVSVTVTGSDESGVAPAITLIEVTSSEPDDGLGDGDTANDIQGADIGTNDTHFQVRAERQGGGPGRIYTATYRATDAAGNAAYASATILVPKSHGASASGIGGPFRKAKKAAKGKCSR